MRVFMVMQAKFKIFIICGKWVSIQSHGYRNDSQGLTSQSVLLILTLKNTKVSCFEEVIKAHIKLTHLHIMHLHIC